MTEERPESNIDAVYDALIAFLSDAWPVEPGLFIVLWKSGMAPVFAASRSQAPLRQFTVGDLERAIHERKLT
ncbi:hypothetical protein [uncultured Chitinophaga sp.]|uniref:hypothetical protein n=1 Tax=uncultured Chitinophaga sp. TaxID=339340 RepID=UPI002612E33B|nr:hypothetical protein [uncultured Chitinophaga sp.]